MALYTVPDNNRLIKFRKDLTREYIRGNSFSPYTGEGSQSIIRIVNDLKAGGDTLNVPFVGRLRQRAISTGTLVGNEEPIDSAGMRVFLDWARNAVVTTKAQLQRQSAPIFETARDQLQDWGKELIRDEQISAFHSIPSLGQPAGLLSANGQRINGILQDAATGAQRNQWLTDNADRMMFGGVQGAMVAGNFAASLQNIGTGAMLSCAMINKAKRRAKQAQPRIRPFMVKDTNKEYFVVFCGSNAFRDIQSDPVMVSANTNARAREGNGMDKNPLFQDGDLIYNGVIIREIPEMDILLPYFYQTAGTGGIQVAPAFMCGQSAMIQAWGQMPKINPLRETDYEFRDGVGVDMAVGFAKAFKQSAAGLGTSTGLREYGVFTLFTASQPDT